MISTVVPGTSVTIALNWPMSLLKSVDFQTFVAQTSHILNMEIFAQIKKITIINYKNLPQKVKRKLNIDLHFLFELVYIMFRNFY